jgi:hypothetical protein
MVSLTLAVTPELKKKMEKYSDINWSAVARSAIEERIKWLSEMDELTKNSKLTIKDTVLLGRKVKKAAAKRYIKEMK